MSNPADLSYLQYQSEDERARMRAVVRARRYHEDMQPVELTDRLREFLAIDGDQAFVLNVAAIVVEAAAERLKVIGFDSDEAPDAEGVKPVAAWAWERWQQNRMDGIQDEVHEGAVRDGEYFLLIDGDDMNRRARFTPHQRYTAVYDHEGRALDGDGEGIRVYYANNSDTGAIVRAVKHWTEKTFENTATGTRVRNVRRLNVYLPDRLERYVWGKGAWELLPSEPGRPNPQPWLDRTGSPLGVPIVHFRNTNMRCEAARAWPIQDAINKAFVDLIAAEDIAALGILVTLGFFPTSDGQPQRADGSNALPFQPGSFLSTNKGPSDANAFRIPGEDVTQLITAIDAKIKWLAGITSTPPSRFQASTNVRAEGTLKQEEGPLLAKLEPKMTLFGNAWEDAFYLARRIEETFYGAALAADAILAAQWGPTATRDEKAEREALTLEKNLGVPLQFLLPKLGYSEWEISEIMKAKEQEAQQELERAQAMAVMAPRSTNGQEAMNGRGQN